MVRVEMINKHFGKQQVLKDVSFAIEKGAIVGLLGPNGAGKSTLMKILIGLLTPDNGVVQCPERVGYLPERNPLYEEMYVREYLYFIARLVHAEQEVEGVIDRVGLRPEATKHIRQLSKGYHQRVGLAAAMLGNPDLLILDEPTTGLDPNQLEDIRHLIQEIGQHHTVILSTHILQEVKEMCTRVIIIDHGRICADKPMNEITDLEELFRQSTNH
ncbi:MAG: ATP-binding cassette domain-containing protein [Paludibacteraceae bacterium]|nr:ATP-binding cassette domain-containing protein [Paludibacteraceae bacterium]